MSSAAIIAVYSAGYTRTQVAADRFEERRPADPRPARVTSPIDPLPVAGVASFSQAPDKTERIASTESSRDLPKQASAPSPAEASVPSSPELSEAPADAPASIQVAASISSIPDHPADATPAAAPQPEIAMWKDGTYSGWGFCRHGSIEAEVRIENGRIASASISQCRTRYSCTVIDRLPPEIAQRQSAQVDYVSGATQSAQAFSDAVYEALSKAK